MQAGNWFWVLMVLWLVLGGYTNRADLRSGKFIGVGGDLLLFVLLALLGWKLFGPPLQ